MFETFDIQEIDKLKVKPFEYIYPKSFEVEGMEYKNIGQGLYLRKAIDWCTLQNIKDKVINANSNMCFVGLRNYHSDNVCILFAYSRRFSTWDKKVIERYWLDYRHELDLLEFSEQYVNQITTMLRESKDCRGSIELTEFYVDTFDCELGIDTPFEIDNQSNNDYILVGGKVGTKVREGIYEFKDNLVYRHGLMYDYSESSTSRTYRLIVPTNIRFNKDCVYLFERCWSGSPRMMMNDKNAIKFICYDINNKEIDEIKDILGLEKQTYIAREYKESSGIINMQEILEFIDKLEESSPIEVDTGKVVEKDSKEIFKGYGYKNNWQIYYKFIYNFKGKEDSLSCSYCYCKDNTIVAHDSEGNVILRLPISVLRYLRISVTDNSKCIGHTFIKDNNDKEISILGEDTVKYFKHL